MACAVLLRRTIGCAFSRAPYIVLRSPLHKVRSYFQPTLIVTNITGWGSPSIRSYSSTMIELPADSFRLPQDVRPTHYDITVKTDLKEEVFEGLVKVK